MAWSNYRYLEGILEAHSPLTVAELAARAQLSESAVRRHVAAMVRCGAARALGGQPERYAWEPPAELAVPGEAVLMLGSLLADEGINLPAGIYEES